MKRRGDPAGAAFLVAGLAGSSVAVAAELDVHLPEPGFGYTIGDRLHQRIFPADRLDRLVLPAAVASGSPASTDDPASIVVGRSADPGAGAMVWPALGRATPWLQRVAVARFAHSDGRQGLELVYQVVNVPGSVTRVALPALTLSLVDGGRVDTDAADVFIGPLLPDDPELQPLPDRSPLSLPTAHLERTRNASLLTLACCLVLGAAWWAWRARREATRLPFMRAWLAVRRATARDGGARASAWAAMHRALNDTAGRTVHAGNLEPSLAGQRWLLPHTAALDEFFRASDAHFFAPTSTTEPKAISDEQGPDEQGDPGDRADRFDLVALSRTLMRAERRAAR